MPPTSSPVPPVPFLPSVPFFLLPSPSTPSPAAHPLTRSDGVRPSGRDVIATDRPATSNRRAALCHPARLALFLPAVPFRLPRSSRSFRSSFLSLFVLILSARSRLLPFPLPVPRSSLSPSYRLTAKPSPPPHHQPGRAIPSRSPCRPSPPCRGAFAYMRTPPERGGGRVNISGRRGCSARKFVSGFFARLYRSKYQLFNFSARLCRAKPVRRGNDNDT